MHPDAGGKRSVEGALQGMGEHGAVIGSRESEEGQQVAEEIRRQVLRFVDLCRGPHKSTRPTICGARDSRTAMARRRRSSVSPTSKPLRPDFRAHLCAADGEGVA
jgi:hypothetical protein